MPEDKGNPQFPTRTEGPLTLPDGTQVWIKTLNATQRRRAEREGQLRGQMLSGPVRKGGSAYSAYLTEFRGMSAEQHALFVAGAAAQGGELAAKAEDLFPYPSPPDREKEDTEVTFLQKMDKHTKAIETADKKRDDKEKELYDKLYAEVLAMQTKQRVELCMNTQVSKLYWEGYGEAFSDVVIYFAIRTSDDKLELYYGNDMTEGLRRVADLDDEVREAILGKYNSMYEVRAKEIPT